MRNLVSKHRSDKSEWGSLIKHKIKAILAPRAVASGVKGGSDFRGPQLRGPPRRSQPPDRGQPKKTLRTDGPLLRIVTKAYHLHLFLSLANLNIKKKDTRAMFGAHAESRVSLTARPNRALLRLLLHLNKQIQIAV